MAPTPSPVKSKKKNKGKTQDDNTQGETPRSRPNQESPTHRVRQRNSSRSEYDEGNKSRARANKSSKSMRGEEVAAVAQNQRNQKLIDPEKAGVNKKLAGRDWSKPSADQKLNIREFLEVALKVGAAVYMAQFAANQGYCVEPVVCDNFIRNMDRNRHKQMYCLDRTRVVLEDGFTNTYIHANWVRGGPLLNDFIATTGPLEKTVWDFWRMAEFTNTGFIGMLCDFVENKVSKCEVYFPTAIGQSMTGLDMKLTCIDRKSDDKTAYTLLELHKEGKPPRLIRHYQYKAWPDHEVPTTAFPLLRMLDKFRRSTYRTIIHCSAGIGRTGTLIASEYLLQTILSSPAPYDLMQIVRELRGMRYGMVQNEKQFVFILYIAISAAVEQDPKYAPLLAQFAALMKAQGINVDATVGSPADWPIFCPAAPATPDKAGVIEKTAEAGTEAGTGEKKTSKKGSKKRRA